MLARDLKQIPYLFTVAVVIDKCAAARTGMRLGLAPRPGLDRIGGPRSAAGRLRGLVSGQNPADPGMDLLPPAGLVRLLLPAGLGLVRLLLLSLLPALADPGADLLQPPPPGLGLARLLLLDGPGGCDSAPEV